MLTRPDIEFVLASLDTMVRQNGLKAAPQAVGIAAKLHQMAQEEKDKEDKP